MRRTAIVAAALAAALAAGCKSSPKPAVEGEPGFSSPIAAGRTAPAPKPGNPPGAASPGKGVGAPQKPASGGGARPAPAAAGGSSLYKRLGGEVAVTAVIDEFVARLSVNPLIKDRFEGSNVPRLRRMLIEQVCAASGGPQKYTGRDMKTVHRGMGVTDAEFDALVGDLVGALDRFRVPEREKGELLAVLGPMRKDIVYKPPAIEEKIDKLELQLLKIERRLDAIVEALQSGTAPEAAPARPAAAPGKPAPARPKVPPTRFTPEEKEILSSLIARFDATGPDAPPPPLPRGEPRDDLIGRPLDQTRFLSSTGEVFDLRDFEGRKKVVLVILRGFAGQVCINCSAQTLALAKNVKEFERRGAEIVLVYPGEAESLPAFIESVQSLREGFAPPFPIVLDVELSAVRTFRIEGSLAKPTSLVLDEGGTVRYAYVGRDPADRPSAKVLLDAVDRIAK